MKSRADGWTRAVWRFSGLLQFVVVIRGAARAVTPGSVSPPVVLKITQ
jgi:hypothetical protein